MLYLMHFPPMDNSGGGLWSICIHATLAMAGWQDDECGWESDEEFRDDLQTAIHRSLESGTSTVSSCVLVIATGPNLNPPLTSREFVTDALLFLILQEQSDVTVISDSENEHKPLKIGDSEDEYKSPSSSSTEGK